MTQKYLYQVDANKLANSSLENTLSADQQGLQQQKNSATLISIFSPKVMQEHLQLFLNSKATDAR
jgi:hypothetical protein